MRLFSLFHHLFLVLAFLWVQYLSHDIYVTVYFGGIGEVSDSRLMREDNLVLFICFLDSGTVVHMYLLELDVVGYVRLRLHAWKELRRDVESDNALFKHNILDIERQEPIEGRNLLRNEPMLFEVGSDDSPSIVLIDVLHL